MNLSETATTYLNDLLKGNPKVLISTHYNPDGDAIGSSLALYHFLISIGIKAEVLIPNDLPSFLQWMPGIEKATVYTNNVVIGDALIANAELIFCMDYNGLNRVKLFTDKLRSTTATRILIDHHVEPENEFDLAFSVTSVSSTAELLYFVLIQTGLCKDISREMAECLFVGIMTDTGSFSYSCNHSETFEIVGKLIDTGIDLERIHRLVYDTYSESRMRLLGYCLSTRLKVLPEAATAYIWLTSEDLSTFNYQQGDTEGVVNYALSIQNVALAALFTERDDHIRVSLRSKGNFSVNEFARAHFNGGGHRNAAGGDIFMPMTETLSWFEALVSEYTSQIRQSLAIYE